MKRLLTVLLSLAFLGGCSNYFSDYRTVYRIETTTGERYYSDSEPDLDSSNNRYEIEDLDGNTYQFDKGRIHKIEKFKHKK